MSYRTPSIVLKGDKKSIRDLARFYCADAVDTLYSIMMDKSVSPPTRVVAANCLITHGVGKPPISTEPVELPSQISDMTNDQLRAEVLTLKHQMIQYIGYKEEENEIEILQNP